MSKQRNLVKNILSIGVVQIANYLIPVVSIPIIVRIIGPGNFGIINYYASFTAYFILLISYGFDYSGTRFIAVEKEDITRRNKHFTKVVIAKFFLFLISLAIFSISILFISKSENETKVAIYTYLVTIAWTLSPNWFYQGMQQLTKLAIFNFISKLLSTILILVIIKQKADYVWQPLVLSVTQILMSLASMLYAIKKFNIIIEKVSLKSVFQLLWEDRMIFFSMIATNLYTDTNIVILGFYESKEHVGYFTAAWKLMFVVLAVISIPITQAMFPYIADSFSFDINKGITQIKKILPIIIYGCIGVSIALCLLAKLLILGFYGSHFESTVLIFRILTLVPVLSFINSMLGLQTMVNLKMDKPFFKITLLGGIFSIIFNVIIVQLYGYIGCSFSWIISELFIAIVFHFYLKKKGYNLFELKYYNPKNMWLEIQAMFLNLRRKVVK